MPCIADFAPLKRAHGMSGGGTCQSLVAVATGVGVPLRAAAPWSGAMGRSDGIGGEELILAQDYICIYIYIMHYYAMYTYIM